MKHPGRPSFFKMKRIIDPEFQLEMLLRAACYTACLIAFISAGVFIPLISSMAEESPDIDAATVMLYMHENFWTVAILCIGLAMCISVRLSHRIAGPLYRLKQCLRSTGTGELPQPAKTRKHDYLKHEIEVFNEMVESLATATDEIKEAEREAARGLESLLAELPEHQRQELGDTIERLEQDMAKLHEKVHFFRRAEKRSPAEVEKPARTESVYEQPMMS